MINDQRTVHRARIRSWLVGLILAGCLVAAAEEVLAQDQNVAVHRRGHLWESIWNYGMIGDLGAWDYLTPRPVGLYPGFTGFIHPTGGEFNAVNTWANANMHNFRSGIWIGARNVQVPGTPPDFQPQLKPYQVYLSNVQQGLYGMPSQLPPITLNRNYVEENDFNPLLPEEWTESTWQTNLGITVTRRTYVWGFPGFRDFIIYDYILENTGHIVSTLVGEVVPNVEDFQQTLQDVYFALHSGISVSTKSQINFHCELNAVQAGAFGWEPASYHDYYYLSEDKTLAFSYNYNGGKEPTPWNPYCEKDPGSVQQRFGPELQSPAGFGWVSLYADPAQGSNPNSPAPDVLRIDSHKGGTFQGQDLDFEFFTRQVRGEQGFYELMTSSDLQPGLGNDGNRMNFYTFSYGPYTMPPGAQVRIVMAEIAGVMDYADVVAGDPDGLFPEATIDAIKANAERARQAVSWGIGVDVDGIPLAADVPEPPPAPNTDAVNASVGTEVASIAVTWDDIAESAVITDGSGGTFYDGSQDLTGYRIYRTQDFQFTSDGQPPSLRGAHWDLLFEMSVAEAAAFWDEELERYRFVDESVDFGRRYGYYVAAYNETPGTWTSANGTVVSDLPELVSGDYNRSAPANAVAGPVESFDVYAVPNPYVFGDPQRSFGQTGVLGERTIEFRNLPERATIRIYTVSGDLVRTLQHGPDSRGNLSGTIAWDQKSESGLIVAPGLYIFHVTSDTEHVDGRLTGKLMIIR
jgi:hypothetical protein